MTQLKLHTIIILVFLIQVNHLFSQSDFKKFAVEFYDDNDYFNIPGKVTDRYYTNGLRLGIHYTKQSLKNNFPDNLLLSFKSDTNKKVCWNITQYMFTPIDITKETLDANDWPYSGAIVLAHNIHSINENKTLGIKSEFQIGILGPWSFAKEAQTWYHKTLGFLGPKGWDTQLHNSLILGYDLALQPKIYANTKIKLLGNIESEVGSLINQFRGGLILTLGENRNFSEARFKKPKANFVFTSNMGWVLYNSYLQGGLLKLNMPNNYAEHVLPASEINNFYFEATIGINFKFHDLSFSYNEKFRTPQTKNTDPLLIGNLTFYF